MKHLSYINLVSRTVGQAAKNEKYGNAISRPLFQFSVVHTYFL